MGRDKTEKRKHKKERKNKHKKDKKAKRDKAKSTKRKSPKNSDKEEPEQQLKDEHLEEITIPIELMNTKSHAPERKEDYEKRQSHIRREKDPITGRVRLIKGDSEVLEEIVTRVRHTEINKAATRSDGQYFQQHTSGGRRRAN